MKWKSLKKGERESKARQLEGAFRRSALSQMHPRARFEVFDASYLSTLAR